MKRTIITLMLAGAMMALTIPAALANSENSNGTAGAGTTECRPGPQDNDLVGGWEQMTRDEYVQDIYEVFDVDLSDAERVKRINDSADATWAFCDKNLDGTLCVLKTEISPYYYTLLDNRPFRPATG
jgi:hypothetical protein